MDRMPPPHTADLSNFLSQLSPNKTQNIESLPLYTQGKFFISMFREIKRDTKGVLFENMVEAFNELELADKKRVEEQFNKFPSWGGFNPRQNQYDVLKNRAVALYDNAEEFIWLYRRLADYRSRYFLHALIENWVEFNIISTRLAAEQAFYSCFDLDIMRCEPTEVLVDCGAKNGDTVLQYINTYGGASKYKRIYCYETSPYAFTQLKAHLKQFPNIDYRLKRVSAQTVGGMVEEIVSIDEDITEPITFIKMDIGGAEHDALRGCARQIAANKPKLAISLYHNIGDIWKIPRLIDEICPGYRFYLRFYGDKYVPVEYSLLAVFGG